MNLQTEGLRGDSEIKLVPDAQNVGKTYLQFIKVCKVFLTIYDLQKKEQKR